MPGSGEGQWKKDPPFERILPLQQVYSYDGLHTPYCRYIISNR
jgi:hypothetical protein